MSILSDASAQDLKRLLELFPISNLKQDWGELKGTKDEICFAIATQKDIARIAAFINNNFGCCKQHVYVFERPDDVISSLNQLTTGEKVLEPDSHTSLFVVRVRYTVILRDPLEEAAIEFLWPVRVEVSDRYVVVRFVVLQKSMSSYFERSHYLAGRTEEEEDLIARFAREHNLKTADLHKGIKTLWAEGFMDSPKAHFKKPVSVALESMDEEKGIREHNPVLYEEILESPLFRTMFIIPPGKKGGTEVFFADPSKGYLIFPRYAEERGDTDFVIGEILRRNQ